MGNFNYKWKDIINIPFTTGNMTRGSSITTFNQYFNNIGYKTITGIEY